MTSVIVIRPYATLPSEGGSNDRYVNLCKKLKEQGAGVRLLCSDFVHNSKKRRTRIDHDVNRRDLPFLVPIRTLSYKSNLSVARIAHEAFFGVGAFVYLLVHRRPEVIVVGEPLFGAGWLIQLYGLLFRVPVLADVIDLWPEADTAVRAGILRRMAYGILRFSRWIRLRCYRAVSFVSRSYAARLDFNPEERIFYWGSELTPGKVPPPSDGKLCVIYAGSFGVGYDMGTVLKAAERIHREMPGRFHIVFAGSGPQLADVKRAHAAGYIEYLGVLDRYSLIKQYETSDIGLLPYKPGSMVAMPIKFFDYMNFGLYTLTSLDLEAGEIVTARKIGKVYKAGDADDLFRTLKEIAANPDELSRARQTVAASAVEFSAKVQYDRFARFVLGFARPSH